MIEQDISIVKYGWFVRVFFWTSPEDVGAVSSALDEIRCPRSIKRQARCLMERGRVNEGFTFSNSRMRSSVMLMGVSSSGRQFFNSFTHELRHLTDDIAIAEGMEMSGEEVAYLTGAVAMTLADVVCGFSCECCRRKRRLYE